MCILGGNTRLVTGSIPVAQHPSIYRLTVSLEVSPSPAQSRLAAFGIRRRTALHADLTASILMLTQARESCVAGGGNTIAVHAYSQSARCCRG